jgi:hypothetical protein
VLALYRLTLRFGANMDTDQLTARITALVESLRRIDEEIEGRLSRGLVQLENTREALRDHVGEAQRASARLLCAAATEPVAETPAATPIVAAERAGLTAF